MALNYVDQITSANLKGFLNQATAVFPGFTTVNESYKAKLEEMNASEGGGRAKVTSEASQPERT